MTADNRDPVRVLGRINGEQWDAWHAAASRLGLTFTAFAKLALDNHSTITQPRRKLPKQIQNKGPKKTK